MLSAITRASIKPSRMASRAFISTWNAVPQGPPDAILGVTEAFRKDTSPNKMNLGVGAYRDDGGKPYVLTSVKKAEKILIEKNLDKEYAGITGVPAFTKAAGALAYGDDSSVIAENRLAITQSISGTGALRIGAEFLNAWYPHAKNIIVPNPTWGNHIPIMKNAGLNLEKYTYFDKQTNGLNIDGMLEDLHKSPKNTIVLLHACAHNPTGVDPTKEQWDQISKVIKEREHFAFFDMAYQGFASGDCTNDAYALRKFVDEGHQVILAQSFAKNMGLYGERVGSFSVVCADAEEKSRVDSQLKIIIRPMYSNPPIHGAHLVHTVLDTPELKKEWLGEVKHMADRIITMRQKLRGHLENDFGSKKSWNHITDQIGMFCYSGMTPEQVDKIKSEWHVYLTQDGRISMAGISSQNVKYLAEAIHNVTKD
ncbi:aspartate aminotransferase [Gilbertella persicaria]|uniref:Aspartate aminotransferase n=1 Tax=Rhizopus stolonifer TaxID=4846 RepID=A0A367KHZ1_RHIST|nr:aspartate aminotransferase [Gilbertella persicaria]KAI8071130.1 aspartate aminotransferase [Gilbertella persicaria]RCI01844.1 aspartate transaminase aat1 [Rhizopus stolonifer]